MALSASSTGEGSAGRPFAETRHSDAFHRRTGLSLESHSKPLLPCLTRGRSGEGGPPRVLVKVAFDNALQVQQPLAVKNVARLRRVHPDKSPQELLS
jgi:hypothetical protein